MRPTLSVAIVLTLAIASLPAADSPVTRADYDRADALRAKYEALAVDIAGPATWIGKTGRVWYRKAVTGGHQFVIVDARTTRKQPAFDHDRLAAGLSDAGAGDYTGLTLPFNTFSLVDNENALSVTVDGSTWKCRLSDYACEWIGVAGGPGSGRVGPQATLTRLSPDGKWEAVIDNYNVAVRAAASQTLTPLSTDGSEGDPYVGSTIVWSPDSKKLAVYRVRPGYRREVHYVESSPSGQLQPKHSTIVYAKPGDVLDRQQPVLFDVDAKRQFVVDNALFANPFSLSPFEWRKDSRAVTFEYNQRGHQLYRIVEVEAETGRARAVLSEECTTFFNYRTANGSQTDTGKKFRHDVDDGQEVIWMSERDGWNHLYLIDGATGRVKNQITKGSWVVRAVQHVDEARRQIWFSASGMNADEDPYFVHCYRIGFDGSGLTPLTPEKANHNAAFSDDTTFFVDTSSGVDMAPIVELRRPEDGSLVSTIERGDIAALRTAGWTPPETFVAKGRDGRTDIWGVIVRPTNFDPMRKYLVIENIYAGPQGSFVPKSFQAFNPMQAQAELGFIVVQIDGMGTAHRSKAFQDVIWQNLKDAGFEDRILWHKAVAAKYSWYDITRVGIYGTSAGGQSALGALLFHPEFYKAAVSAAGCHDNRMDKIWWNEQWMGWPLGPHYAASSNVDNAYRLQGALLLVVGEMDTNVDPSSTMQVVNQLIQHDKEFDLLYIPGAGHGAGGAYGERKRFDFFVRHLLGAKPPTWNSQGLSRTDSPADLFDPADPDDGLVQ
jgi:dipeptidyl aminopeptidase/acylaminoacyl peptidase